MWNLNQNMIKQRYKQVGGKRLIEVRIKNHLQLFDSRDPAPFRERDLDENFVEYITTSAKEFSFSVPLKIVIYVDELENKGTCEESIREAVLSYFRYQIDAKKSELKSFLKRAHLFLVIGLLVLAACLGVAQNITVPTPPGALGILREGIVIFGWVSIWKPIELFLFDWYPLYEKIRLHKKLLQTELEIRFEAE